MKRVGIVSYNMYGNFTNYGSALQSFALQKAIDSLLPGEIESVIVDYCPKILEDKDVLNPIANMWDTDSAIRESCRMSMPAIKRNYIKFLRFYDEHYRKTEGKYNDNNFNESLENENLNGYVCGSDTVFAVPEFGFDNGFYANYSAMRRRSIAYAASFGDYAIPESDLSELKAKLSNFNAIALRENDKLHTVKSIVSCPVEKVIDPTLLLTPEEYEQIMYLPDNKRPYILLYSRRRDECMQKFAEEMAQNNGFDLVEISLTAQNAEKHEMRYDAGVEEFLGLVNNASIVVTNSFHGMIFAVQFKTPFYIFSRKLCDTKILEVLKLFGINDRFITENFESKEAEPIEYDKVHSKIAEARRDSLEILKKFITEKIPS